MTEKTRIEIALLLPAVPDVRGQAASDRRGHFRRR